MSKTTRIFISSHHDDNGVREMDVIGEPSDAWIKSTCGNGYFNWFKEGETWHRTRDAAVEAARRHRRKRIADASERLAHLTSLPEIE